MLGGELTFIGFTLASVALCGLCLKLRPLFTLNLRHTAIPPFQAHKRASSAPSGMADDSQPLNQVSQGVLCRVHAILTHLRQPTSRSAGIEAGIL